MPVPYASLDNPEIHVFSTLFTQWVTLCKEPWKNHQKSSSFTVKICLFHMPPSIALKSMYFYLFLLNQWSSSRNPRKTVENHLFLLSKYARSMCLARLPWNPCIFTCFCLISIPLLLTLKKLSEITWFYRGNMSVPYAPLDCPEIHVFLPVFA